MNTNVTWAATMLVNHHFPEIQGLQPTQRSKIRMFQKQGEESIQLHNSGAHWVMSTLIDGEVRLYDSLNSMPGFHNPLPKQPVGQLYGRADEKFRVTIVPVVQQSGSTDCGLYARAYLFHLTLAIHVSGQRSLWCRGETGDMYCLVPSPQPSAKQVVWLPVSL